MIDAPALAITGATGAVGRLTAEELARGGAALRLLARTPSRAPQLPGSVVVESSYGDSDQARASLEGVSTLLMVSAGEEEGWPEKQLGFVAAAADAGVEHIVYTSFQGASADATFTYGRDHFATEEAIRASGMAWTMLRDSFYLDFVTLLPGPDGALRGPAGDGRVAAVAKLDVARSAAAVLREPGAHAGRTYEVTGPEALSFADFAAALTGSTGRPIRYIDETLEEGRRWREAFGAPEWQLQGWLTTFSAIAKGEHTHVTDDVELLTGRKPISLRELLLG
ncbi:SDR family oxidoreductase [Agrococcus sp. ARC_14]|uniref:SDR family oxidoreductase n=1 Tax=Agrococcus sp. ARC_14 TaxID=2919927 RepID=UPI001F05E804|nr:SDR family oxidoreductase [Agrococcus sp. ARC_14]MCH1884399.1 SDR family oxidoreductase [Agrococcus sp. ARC_14]